MPPVAGRPTRWARGLCLVLHLALVVALPFVAGLPGVLLALPLLAPLPGLWRRRPYTYAWCSLLLAFYVGAFLMEAWAQPPRAPVAIALALLAAAEFCALLLYVRFRAVDQRRAGALSGTPPSPDRTR